MLVLHSAQTIVSSLVVFSIQQTTLNRATLVTTKVTTTVQVRDSVTWRHPVSVAPGADWPPSWPGHPQTGVSSPPAPCAGPPDSSSSAHDASTAAEEETF